MPDRRAAADYSGCKHAWIARTRQEKPGIDDEPIVKFATLDEWERWLEQNHADVTGVWMKIAKKGAPEQTINYPEVLDAAICQGWIDARRRGLDETLLPAALHAADARAAAGHRSTATRRRS